MGLFSTIKNKLGIGGVNIEFTIPAQVQKTSQLVEGTITLTTKSEQEVLKVEALLKEEYSTGMGDNKTEKILELGKWSDYDAFTIKPGDVKTFPFQIHFEEIKSYLDGVSEKGGFLGGLGKAGKFLNAEKSKYFVEVNVDVKSAVLDPTEKKDIKLA